MSIEQKPKALILIDYSNYHYGLARMGWDIDYNKLRAWFESKCHIIKAGKS